MFPPLANHWDQLRDREILLAPPVLAGLASSLQSAYSFETTQAGRARCHMLILTL